MLKRQNSPSLSYENAIEKTARLSAFSEVGRKRKKYLFFFVSGCSIQFDMLAELINGHIAYILSQVKVCPQSVTVAE